MLHWVEEVLIYIRDRHFSFNRPAVSWSIRSHDAGKMYLWVYLSVNSLLAMTYFIIHLAGSMQHMLAESAEGSMLVHDFKHSVCQALRLPARPLAYTGGGGISRFFFLHSLQQFRHHESRNSKNKRLWLSVVVSLCDKFVLNSRCLLIRQSSQISKIQR